MRFREEGLDIWGAGRNSWPPLLRMRGRWERDCSGRVTGHGLEGEADTGLWLGIQ